MKLLFGLLLSLSLLTAVNLGLTATKSDSEIGKSLAPAKKAEGPLSEVQFRITDISFGRLRLLPEKVEETTQSALSGCRAPEGGTTIEGRFSVEFEIEGKRIATYSLDLSFVEGQFWSPRLRKSDLPLAGQSKEQIVIIRCESCNTIKALIFGYDLNEKEIVRYSFSDSEPWRVSLSVGTRFFFDGRIEVLSVGKPDGILQKRIYSNAGWGTLLDRYSFDRPTHRFLKIPMIVGIKVQVDSGSPTARELVLYEDGYMTDMQAGRSLYPRLRFINC